MPRISAVLNPVFRSGEKNGKPWTLMSIRTDDDKEATIFAPAAVGDEVELTFNDKYQNWTASKAKKSLSGGQLSQIQATLEEHTILLNKILFKLGGSSTTARTQAEEIPATDDLPPTEIYDEPPF